MSLRMASKPTKEWHTWKETKVHLLFKLYEARPFMWDKKHKDYLNRELKSKALEEMGRELNCTSQVVKETWKAMRDNFQKEARLMNATVTRRLKKRPWRYYEGLKFLATAPSTVVNIHNNGGTNISGQYESQQHHTQYETQQLAQYMSHPSAQYMSHPFTQYEPQRPEASQFETQSFAQYETETPAHYEPQHSPASLKSVVEETDETTRQTIRKRMKKTSKPLKTNSISRYLAELQREPDDIELFASTVAADLRNMRNNGASKKSIELTKLKIRRILLTDIDQSVRMMSSETAETSMEHDETSMGPDGSEWYKG